MAARLGFLDRSVNRAPYTALHNSACVTRVIDYSVGVNFTAQNIASPQVWRLGALPVAGRAILAPLSGVTDVGMRRAAQSFGASLVVSEMVAADAYVAADEEARLRAEGAGVSPHVVQIAGRAPETLAEAARLAEAAGADVVDINMGCPAKRVVGGYAGSALMREPDLAVRLVRAVDRRGAGSRHREDAARLGRCRAAMRRNWRGRSKRRAPR